MNMYASLKNLDFLLSGDFTADVTDVKTTATMDSVDYKFDGVSYMKKAKVAMNAALKADLKNDKYTFEKNSFKVNALTLGLDGWLKLLPNDDMDMDLKFDSKQTDFRNILSMVPAVYLTDFKDVKTVGKLALNGFAKGKYTSKAYPAFGLNLNIANAMFKYPDLPKSVNNIQVVVNINSPGSSLDQMVINMKKFHMEMAGNPFDATMLLKTPISDPDIAAALKGKIDLGSIKDIIPEETKGQNLNGIITSDVALKGKMSSLEKEQYDQFQAKGTFGIKDMNYISKEVPYGVKINTLALDFTPQMVNLSAFDSKIGKSDLQATGHIDNFLQYALTDSATLKGVFNMTSNNMNLNQFMEEDSTATATGSTGNTATAATTAASDTAAEMPLSVFEVPGNLDITLNAVIKKLLYENINITNINASMGVKNKKVNISKSSMDLMDGSMTMTGFYETTNPKKPGINFVMDVKDFDVNKTATTFNTVKKLAPIAKSANGHFSSKLNVTGSLDEHMMPVYNTLNGGGNLVTRNIVVKDFKPMVKVADALKNEKLKTWDIGDANISFEIKDGKIYVQPFDIKMGKTKVNISGYNTLDEQINYTMKFNIPRSEFGSSANNVVNGLLSQAASKGVNVKLGETVNVNAYVTGTVDKPKVSLGLKDVGKNVKDELKDKAKEEIDKAKEEAKKKAKEELQKQAQKMIAEAQKQADNVRKEAQRLAAQTKKTGYAQAQQLEDNAKNPLAKIAAKKGAEEIRKQTDKKAQKIIDEGNKKADAIVKKAKESAAKLTGGQ